MMKRLLLLLLLLLISIGGYVYYRQAPEQKIGRVIEQFLENIEHRKISIRRQIDVHEALKEVLALKVNFQGNFPIPTEELTQEEVLAQVDFFHSVTSLCKITEVERSIKIIGSKAQVYQTVNILAAAGKNDKDEQAWDLIFDLEKNEDWRIVGLRGTKH